MADTKVQVAVRVRPLNKREIDLRCSTVIQMKGNQTVLLGSDKVKGLAANKGQRSFRFDHSFWSSDRSDDHYADQALVYEELGTGVLDNALQGFNACIFAYGQTGSGKSYTMMGPEDDKGLIPRLCGSLFDVIGAVVCGRRPWLRCLHLVLLSAVWRPRLIFRRRMFRSRGHVASGLTSSRFAPERCPHHLQGGGQLHGNLQRACL